MTVTPLAPFQRIRFEDICDILCARCQAPLVRHQPDENEPNRLLGTCDDCGSWFLLDLSKSIMLVLPETESETSA